MGFLDSLVEGQKITIIKACDDCDAWASGQDPCKVDLLNKKVYFAGYEHETKPEKPISIKFRNSKRDCWDSCNVKVTQIKIPRDYKVTPEIEAAINDAVNMLGGE